MKLGPEKWHFKQFLGQESLSLGKNSKKKQHNSMNVSLDQGRSYYPKGKADKAYFPDSLWRVIHKT